VKADLVDGATPGNRQFDVGLSPHGARRPVWPLCRARCVEDSVHYRTMVTTGVVGDEAVVASALVWRREAGHLRADACARCVAEPDCAAIWREGQSGLCLDVRTPCC